jgi:hypothetical protein
MARRTKTKRLKFNLEAGSSIIDEEDKKNTSNFDELVTWNSGLKN